MTIMKKRQPNTPRLNPITPEALVHITDLVERDNIGLQQRCVHYQYLTSVRRTIAASCLLVFFAFSTSFVYANPPLHTDIVLIGTMDDAHACGTLNAMLNRL